MHAEGGLTLATLYAFLLVLARVGGAFVFVPMPGIRSGPEVARVVLSVSLTVALFPLWPVVPASEVSVGRLVAWVAAEGAFGVAVGLAVSFLTESLQLGAQVLGLQAGFSYASTINPSSDADSTVLQVFTQMTGSLLFFALGFDRDIIRVFARSLETIPPGTYLPTLSAAHGMIRLGTAMFSTGVRLAMPVVALLVLVDVSLALLGRINAQLQMLTLAFPVKMLVALALLAATLPVFPALLQSAGVRTIAELAALVRR